MNENLGSETATTLERLNTMGPGLVAMMTVVTVIVVLVVLWWNLLRTSSSRVRYNARIAREFGDEEAEAESLAAARFFEAQRRDLVGRTLRIGGGLVLVEVVILLVAVGLR